MIENTRGKAASGRMHHATKWSRPSLALRNLTCHRMFTKASTS